MSSPLNRAIYEYLTESPAVTALVGDRIYPIGATPTAISYPYITHQAVSASHTRHMSVGSGLAEHRWEFNAWSTSSDEAYQVGEALRELLDNRHGLTMGTGTSEVSVRGVFLDDQDLSAEFPTDGSKVGVHRARLDFIIWNNETVTPV